MTTNMIGRRLGSLHFEKYFTRYGKKKPYRWPKGEREKLIKKYVPKEERETIIGLDGSDRFSVSIEDGVST